MFLKSSVEVFKNSKTKVYSDGTTNTIACRVSLFKDDSFQSLESIKAFEDKHRLESQNCQNIIDYLNAKGITLDEYYERRREYRREHPKEVKHRDNTEVRSDSLKRAKDSIFDYVLNNEFDYFFTGTINPEELDSKDPKELLKPVQRWLKNMVDRYGLSYLMIAERHKKGGIHFHGLCRSSVPLRLEDSGTKLYKGHKKPVSNARAEKLGLTDGRTVYNLKSWKFGFTTCIELTGDRLNTAFYVTKYITKDCKKIFGKFFWHSRDLKKPKVIIEDVDYESILAVEHNGFKYQFKRGGEQVETNGDVADMQLHTCEQ